jgi:putative NIF3 family GTP cyclohydrolase 1 type 2
MLQVRLADVKLADSRDQRRVETPPRVLMKNRAAADRAARAAAAAANGEGSGQANNRCTQHLIDVFVAGQISIRTLHVQLAEFIL